LQGPGCGQVVELQRKEQSRAIAEFFLLVRPLFEGLPVNFDGVSCSVYGFENFSIAQGQLMVLRQVDDGLIQCFCCGLVLTPLNELFGPQSLLFTELRVGFGGHDGTGAQQQTAAGEQQSCRQELVAE